MSTFLAALLEQLLDLVGGEHPGSELALHLGGRGGGGCLLEKSCYNWRGLKCVFDRVVEWVVDGVWLEVHIKQQGCRWKASNFHVAFIYNILSHFVCGKIGDWMTKIIRTFRLI